MINTQPDWLAPHPIWDRVLRLAPLHVFVLDTALVCLYAAPIDDTFLGLSREQLLRRHIGDFFPPAADGLRPSLERVAREQVPWHARRYRYSHRSDDAEMTHIWDITARPVQVDDHSGVLLTLVDVLEMVDQLDRFQRERDGLQHALQQLHQASAEHERALTATAMRLRTLLTPIVGYLQLLVRAPELRREASLQTLLVDALLPQVQELLEALHSLDSLPPAGPQSPPGI